MNKKATEIFSAFGHINVLATHHSTIEFTKETHLSRMGDCILTVGSEKAAPDLSDDFREALRKPDARLTITIEADEIREQVNAFGSPKLFLTHHSDMVVRKSTHVDSRTLGIRADKAARDLSRALVEKLQNPNQKAIIILTVHS